MAILNRFTSLKGALVEAGELLFQIDPRPFELIAERARAEVDQVREQLALAKLQYERANQLVNPRPSLSKSGAPSSS